MTRPSNEECTCKADSIDEHPCPFRADLSDGEDKSLCRCCEFCTQVCVDNV